MSTHLKGLNPGELGDLTIVVGDPGRVDLVGTLLEETRLVTDNRELKLVIGQYRGRTASVCSTGMGSGATEICVTELIENGARRIVRCGGCGAWREGIDVGDIILNTGMVRSSGMMSSYVPDTFPAVADPELLMTLDAHLREGGLTTHRGIGFTSEGYYIGQARRPAIPGALDNRELFDYMTARGILNCEMETAVLYVLGSLYHVPVANALVTHVTRSNDSWASDEAYRERHLASASLVLEACLG